VLLYAEWNAIFHFEKVGSLELSENALFFSRFGDNSERSTTTGVQILPKERLLLKSGHQMEAACCGHARFLS